MKIDDELKSLIKRNDVESYFSGNPVFVNRTNGRLVNTMFKNMLESKSSGDGICDELLQRNVNLMAEIVCSKRQRRVLFSVPSLKKSVWIFFTTNNCINFSALKKTNNTHRHVNSTATIRL